VPPSSSDPVLARLNGKPITLSQIEPTLIESYGLNILLNVVQLELAKQEAARANVTVTPSDFSKEREQTLAKMFPDAEKTEIEPLFDQFLQQQHISKPEFELVLETNTYLRKIAEPLSKDKIGEANLQEAFRQLYGETVQVRHIQAGNMQEILEAKRRLAAGEAFEKVAADMSRNARTAPLGGELPPFSRQSSSYPQAFKDAAFALKEGEISDAVQAEGSLHLIKMERRIPPKAVKFEDVKDALREDLQEQLVQATMKTLRAQLGQDALRGLMIDNPVLKQQYEARLHQRDQAVTEKNQIREQFEKERQRIMERSTTQPAGAATEPAATQPPTPSAPEVARPPATPSGAAPSAAPDKPTTTPDLMP
jgi:hypothetical protein